jgi:O-methyltransferase domain
MTGQSKPIADALASVFSWDKVGSVIDIDSAEGCVPVTLALAHPHLSAAGFDLPEVGPIFYRFIATHGVSDRVRFIPGNFFQDNLPLADVLIMALILHDWDLPTKRMLLGKAHAALPRGDG